MTKKRYLYFVIAFLLCFVLSGSAKDVSIMWDYGQPMPNGFEIQITNSATMIPFLTVDCGAAADKSCIVRNIPAGSWQATCRAYNDSIPPSLGREYSASSAPLLFTIAITPEGLPSNLEIKEAGSVDMRINIPSDKIAVFNVQFDDKGN